MKRVAATTRLEAIRAWMRANPGPHFMDDIVAGMAVTDPEEKVRVRQGITEMTHRGILDAEGSRGAKRYRLGRAPRAYKHKDRAA